MSLKTALLRSVALSASLALIGGAAAHAEPAAKKQHKAASKARRHEARPDRNASEFAAMRAQIQELRARLDAQSQTEQATAAQIAQTQVQVAQAASDVSAAENKVESIPEQVNLAVGALPKPKTDRIYVRGVAITLGGFIEAAGIYRSNAEGADIASNWNTIPYSGQNNATATNGAAGTAAAVGHTRELRFSARQSRISGLVEGDADPDTHLSAYGEFDFISAAQTANSNESNSYNLRIRHLYTTLDRPDEGLHFLAGQTWSLVTMNAKGITPRNELVPLSIDSQYIPGFAWARQPQFRVTDQATKEIWLGVSLENPQTTFLGQVNQLPAAIRPVYEEAAGSGFNSTNTLSLNHIPDAVVKAAYEPTLFGRTMHFEAFGLFSAFYDREAAGITVAPGATPAAAATVTSTATANQNQNVYGGGAGFGLQIPIIPQLIDFQLSGLSGKGVGRYGTAQLPDVTFNFNGQIKPIQETIFLAGVTYHFDKKIDLYGYYGAEQESRTNYSNGAAGTGAYGLGSPLYNNSGCLGEVTTVTTCVGQTHEVSQAAFGAWDKVYQGPMGQMRLGVEYSHTDRHAFPGIGGAPIGQEDIIETSVRYYPFQ